MWWDLEKAVYEASKRKISDYETYRKRVYDENVRRQRRSVGALTPLPVRRPTLWDLDAAYDPFHVRANRRSISRAVARHLQTGTYAPLPPAGFHVAKQNKNESRLVTSFAIADEIVSARVYRSLLRKNRGRFSARSYAYRDDVGVHDAIAHLQSEWGQEHRLFVAEYDFSNYFESLSHEQLRRAISDLGLTITTLERRIVDAFLAAPLPYTNMAEKGALKPRERGVPQGTSISLLLANIAMSPLDRALERLGVGFARYADDTIIWSRDYSAVCRAVEELHKAAADAGSSFNPEKSEGIRLLVTPETRKAEMRFTAQAGYLSHAVGLRSVSIHPQVLLQAKNRITSFLFNNLLREPLHGTQDFSRLSDVDRDYVAYIWQVRRYVYGHMTEPALRRLTQGSVPPTLKLSGLMARFPLADDDGTLRDLDRWIAAQTWLALRRRDALLRPLLRLTPAPHPWNLAIPELVRAKHRSSSTGDLIDLRLPSTLRMAQVVRKAVRLHGTSVLGTGSSLYGYKQQ